MIKDQYRKPYIFFRANTKMLVSYLRGVSSKTREKLNISLLNGGEDNSW